MILGIIEEASLAVCQVPAKPERRPLLPPSKQANKNLILKAVSEAQESITKTTNSSSLTETETSSCSQNLNFSRRIADRNGPGVKEDSQNKSPH